jgi:hypothetical protein
MNCKRMHSEMLSNLLPKGEYAYSFMRGSCHFGIREIICSQMSLVFLLSSDGTGAM